MGNTTVVNLDIDQILEAKFPQWFKDNVKMSRCASIIIYTKTVLVDSMFTHIYFLFFHWFIDHMCSMMNVNCGYNKLLKGP